MISFFGNGRGRNIVKAVVVVVAAANAVVNFLFFFDEFVFRARRTVRRGLGGCLVEIIGIVQRFASSTSTARRVTRKDHMWMLPEH